MSRAVLARKIEASAPVAKTKAAATSLRIGEANDSFEREADRVADAVMGGGKQDWSLTGMSTGAPIQRKCECGGSAGGQCEECKKKESTLQRRAAGNAALSYAPHSVHEALSSSGHPLDTAARAFMEPRFGHDFGKVRIHADANAAASARDVQALAYTVGDHIAFAGGQYRPGEHEGRKLLAHELAHTIQQQGKPAARPVIQRKVILKGSEMPAKDREAFLKSHGWAAATGLPRQVMHEMGQAGDPFDFADENELQREIVKRVSTARHMEESQAVQGGNNTAFGYPFTGPSILYGPRVNYAAREYWEPAVVDNYAVRRDAKKNKELIGKERGERCGVYGDPCGLYAWNLSAKGKADPYKAIVLLFTPQPPHKRSLIHCDYLVSLVLFRSFADAVGIPEFNKRVIAYGINKIQLRWNAFYDLQDTFWGPTGKLTEKGLGEYQFVRPSSEKDLVIGDHVVFYNRGGYPIINQKIGNAWQLENAVLVSKTGKGDDLFLGHGSGHQTDPLMRGKLADEYNIVANKALAIASGAKSKDPKSKSKAIADMSVHFPGIQLVVDKWKIQGTGLQQVKVDEELKRITASEVAGLRNPANLSQMSPVRRPIESKK